MHAFFGIEDRFATTIVENYSLGGSREPQKGAVLKQMVEKHERELILVRIEPQHAADANLDELSADYRKNLKPVILAERTGYGFMEAAEIYSGFMGVMN